MLDASAPGRAYVVFTAGNAAGGRVDGSAGGREWNGRKPELARICLVDDVDAAADRIKRLGGAVHVPPTDVPDISRFSIFADPQAARLALFKWLRPDRDATRAGRDRAASAGTSCSPPTGSRRWPSTASCSAGRKRTPIVGEIGTYQLFSAGGETIGGMLTKPSAIPAPFWLYYFNVGDLDAAAQRVKAGGGRILDGPIEVPGGSWIVQCSDPQGAMFALEGTRGRKAVGYFERGAPRDRSDPRSRRWSW